MQSSPAIEAQRTRRRYPDYTPLYHPLNDTYSYNPFCYHARLNALPSYPNDLSTIDVYMRPYVDIDFIGITISKRRDIVMDSLEHCFSPDMIFSKELTTLRASEDTDPD
jgi:hypothetical protein